MFLWDIVLFWRSWRLRMRFFTRIHWWVWSNRGYWSRRAILSKFNLKIRRCLSTWILSIRLRKLGVVLFPNTLRKLLVTQLLFRLKELCWSMLRWWRLWSRGGKRLTRRWLWRCKRCAELSRRRSSRSSWELRIVNKGTFWSEMPMTWTFSSINRDCLRSSF